MKKIIITLVSSIFLISRNANAVGFNIGGSLTGGVFSVDSASEKNADVTKNSSSEGEDAEGSDDETEGADDPGEKASAEDEKTGSEEKKPESDDE